MSLSFRKEALSALKAADDLDEAIEVTSAATWVAVLAVTIAVASAGLWSAFGTIVTRVEAPALIAYADAQVTEVVAIGDGNITEILVEPGALVKAGDVLARIEDSALVARIEREERIHDEMVATISSIERRRDADIAEFERLADFKIASLDGRLSESRQQADAYRQRVDTTLSLQRSGIATNLAVNAARADLLAINREIGAIEAERVELDLAREERLSQWRLRIVDQEIRLTQQRARADELRNELRITEVVRAPVDGEVEQVLVAAGSFVGTGAKIASIVGPPHPRLEALGFFSAGDAQTIEPGMAVQVSPASTEREETGAIVGSVVDVSRFTVSSNALAARLQNDDLVRAFTQTGPPQIVTISLDLDADGQWTWTGGEPPDAIIGAGSLASAAVAVRERPPISFVLPILRQWAGFG